jgi:hypothetical protein
MNEKEISWQDRKSNVPCKAKNQGFYHLKKEFWTNNRKALEKMI